MAWMMYANEHHGRLCSSHIPYGDPKLDPTGGPGTWCWISDDGKQHEMPNGTLWPYLKNLDVYFCTHDPDKPNTVYAINGLLAGDLGIPKPFLSFQEIKRSSRTFVFIEERVISRRLSGSFSEPIYPAFTFRPDRSCPGIYHPLSGANGTPISFADGHAIFWQYSDPRTVNFAANTPDLDVLQLEAWSGGPVPPGPTP
jgi:hypothetical protein